MLEQLLDKFLRLGFIIVVVVKRIAPGGKIVPACPSGGFRVRRDDFHPFFQQIRPVLDAFGIALAYQEHNCRGVWGAVMLEFAFPAFIDQPLVLQCVNVVA
ncbi:hypothetical protein D3C73_590840 [compost metagenome]